jgi:hypothetical protein
MAVKRQKRKHNLTVQRPIMTDDRLKLTFRFEEIQAVKAFLFLILKTASYLGRRRSAPQGTLATAAARASWGEPLLTRE